MGTLYTKPILTQNIKLVEERCTNLENPSRILSSRHCFIVITTETGQKIKYEPMGDGGCEVDYDYLDWVPSECFRKFYLSDKVSVNEATTTINKSIYNGTFESGIFNCRDLEKNHSNKLEEEIKPGFLDKVEGYSCQHAARDAFNKICKLDEELLRNDFLLSISEIASKSIRHRFLYSDYSHKRIANEYYQRKKNERLKDLEQYSKYIEERLEK